jgi:hypothetical protein
MRELKWITLALVLMLGAQWAVAQSYAFGVKGGMVMGLQRFNGLNNRDILLGYQGDIFIESADDNEQFSLFAAAGYHQRGSAQIFRNGFNPFSGNIIPATSIRSVYHNAVLTAGGKQKFEWGASRYYYSIGLRGEYTIDWNLGFLDFLPNQEQYVQRIIAGVTVGGGLEVPFSEFVAGIVELNVHPDLTRQLFLPQQRGIDRNGNPFLINEQNIYNVSVELTIGLRFLHKIEYVDY